MKSTGEESRLQNLKHQGNQIAANYEQPIITIEISPKKWGEEIGEEPRLKPSKIKNYCSKTIVPKLLFQNYCSKTIVPKLLFQNYLVQEIL